MGDGETAPVRQPLTPDEARRAIALAEDMYRADREREHALSAAGEAGASPEYLARAVARIVSERSDKATSREDALAAGRRIGAVVAIVAALAAIAWPAALWWRPPPGPHGLPPESRYAVAAARSVPQAPSAEAATIMPIAWPHEVPWRLRALPGPTATDVTFENRSPNAVWLSYINETGQAIAAVHLQPGGRYAPGLQRSASGLPLVQSAFGTPWYVTDDAGHPIGVFFPPSRTSTALITGSEPPPDAAQQDGYLQPARKGPRVPRASAQPIGAEIGFVNLTREPVDIYALDRSDQPVWVAGLDPGDDYRSFGAERWVVRNQQGQIVETFAAGSGGGMVAPITEDKP